MTEISIKQAPPQFPFSAECHPFLNWNEDTPDSVEEKAIVFQSLVATVQLQPSLDVSLEAKAVTFLKSVDLDDKESADAFLSSLRRTIDESSTNFIQSIVVLLSSTSRAITTTAMDMLDSLIVFCSVKIRLALVKADLIPQLITNIHPLSLSFAEAVDIHINVIATTAHSLLPATPDDLEKLGIKGENGQQAVHEAVLHQVLVPSEKYICHLCMNRFSIIDGKQSESFLTLLAQLLEICPYYQPTMGFVLNMPVVLTIPSCLTFFENENSIWYFLDFIVELQRKWNKLRGNQQQMWKTVQQLLRMEGIEDVMEAKLRNDKSSSFGGWIVAKSISWNNLLGMNTPRRR
ncbi:hypothetical protein BLNAU_20779 [Blattamonas nauphoetae]|uniref:Uncharacterized protein n=1 Tax=Blattamonas nauphoetae TaxID=2049346 RepID=A0ABQ9WY86_9EUKA|nr:hypothetical protein BLNAU_20779 [Blattamonas nauphoetae]